MFKKLSGRKAELKYTDPKDGIITLLFDNNFKLKKYEKIIKNLGYEYEAVYKRKEWFKQIFRVWWVIVTLMAALSLIFHDNTVLYRAFDVLSLIIFISCFKTNVITLDY